MHISTYIALPTPEMNRGVGYVLASADGYKKNPESEITGQKG